MYSTIGQEKNRRCHGKLEIATRRLARGWNQCPNGGGLFTSQVTWHYTRNLTLRRWITQYLVSLLWRSMLTWSFSSCTSGHVFCISSMPLQARSSTWETEIYSHFCQFISVWMPYILLFLSRHLYACARHKVRNWNMAVLYVNLYLHSCQIVFIPAKFVL